MELSLEEELQAIEHKHPSFSHDRPDTGLVCSSSEATRAHCSCTNQYLLPVMHSTAFSCRRHSDSAVALSPNTMPLPAELLGSNLKQWQEEKTESSESQLQEVQQSSDSAEFMLIEPSCQGCLSDLLHSSKELNKPKLLVHLKCAIHFPSFLCNNLEISSSSQPLHQDTKPQGNSLGLSVLNESLQNIINHKSSSVLMRKESVTEKAEFISEQASMPECAQFCQKISPDQTSLIQKDYPSQAVQSNGSHLTSEKDTSDVVGAVPHLLVMKTEQFQE